MTERKKWCVCIWNCDLFGSEIEKHEDGLIVFHTDRAASTLSVDTDTWSMIDPFGTTRIRSKKHQRRESTRRIGPIDPPMSLWVLSTMRVDRWNHLVTRRVIFARRICPCMGSVYSDVFSLVELFISLTSRLNRCRMNLYLLQHFNDSSRSQLIQSLVCQCIERSSLTSWQLRPSKKTNRRSFRQQNDRIALNLQSIETPLCKVQVVVRFCFGTAKRKSISSITR